MCDDERIVGGVTLLVARGFIGLQRPVIGRARFGSRQHTEPTTTEWVRIRFA